MPPPPLAPLPPFPPCGRMVLGKARTKISRPPRSVSESVSIALSASASVAYLTMPTPLERPSGPLFTSANATSPAAAMCCLSSRQVTSKGRLPTKTVHASADSPSREYGVSRRAPRPPPS
eukprot:scaffold261081_cov24-Tisochrysis_lutea.AAC.1